MEKMTLPNALEIFHMNNGETNFMYEKIFSQKFYLNHSHMQDGGCFFDVGANIGMSSIFFHNHFQNVRCFAFEPIPQIFDCLSANVQLFNINAKIYNLALDSYSGEKGFTVYPNNYIQSGFYCNPQKDKHTIKKVLLNQGFPEDAIHYLIKDLFHTSTITTKVKTITEIIQKEKISGIDFLKIDVEGSEIDVLLGIEENLWDIIRSIAVGAHTERDLYKIKMLLENRGYKTIVEQDPKFRGTAIKDVFGVR